MSERKGWEVGGGDGRTRGREKRCMRRWEIGEESGSEEGEWEGGEMEERWDED